MEEGKEEEKLIKTISKVNSNKKINVLSGHCRHVVRVPFVPHPFCIRKLIIGVYYCPLHSGFD